MAAKRPESELPYLAFAGLEVRLVWAESEEQARIRWRQQWDAEHLGRFAIGDDEVQVRLLRPDDERWVASSVSPFRQLSGGDRKILDALKHVREKVDA